MRAKVEGEVVYVAEDVAMETLYKTLKERNVAFPDRARVVVVVKRNKYPAIILE